MKKGIGTNSRHELRFAFSKIFVAAGLVGAILLQGFTDPAGATGYALPETSARAVATGSSLFAGSEGPETSYYNPARMSFLAPEGSWEAGGYYIHVTSDGFTGTAPAFSSPAAPIVNANGTSPSDSTFVPFMHYVSPATHGKTRFGFSVAAPAGLSKKWDSAVQKTSAEEFSLEVVEFKPTISYLASDNFSIGFGPRIVYSKGTVIYNGPLAGGVKAYSNTIDGDSTDFGFNLALSLRASETVDVGLTYRSKVNMAMKGTARGNVVLPLAVPVNYAFDTTGEVAIPLPATLDFAVAFRSGRTKFEIALERAYWSSYKTLDFQFGDATVETALGAAKDKLWKDTTAVRLGVEFKRDARLTLLGGVVFDSTPVPDKTLGFELPDSDTIALSCGALYKYRTDMEAGFSYLYVIKESRTVSALVNDNKIDGTFNGIRAHMVALSLKKFF